jgi:hypothetical protein
MAVLAINGGAKTCGHQWPAWPVWDDTEGVPLLPGYERPLYRNAVFAAHEAAAAKCPVAEQVCTDTCWIFQTVLLADASAMHSIVDAIGKVCENIGREGLRGRHASVRPAG